MKFVTCLVMSCALTIGCGPQKVVVELTPLEEYKIAAELVDRENALYTEARDKLDLNDPENVKWLDNQNKKLERAQELMKKASIRLDKSGR